MVVCVFARPGDPVPPASSWRHLELALFLYFTFIMGSG